MEHGPSTERTASSPGEDEAIVHLRWLLIPLALLVVVYLGVQGVYIREARARSAAAPSSPGLVGISVQNSDGKTIRSIREIDLAEYLGKTEFRDCLTESPLQKPVVLEKVGAGFYYTDLTGDGIEEAVVNGWSCWAGTGGPDITRVFTLSALGGPIQLEIENHRLSFSGQDYSAGIQSRGQFRILNGNLVQIYPIYRKDDPTCCPEGGWRTFVYTWNGTRFVVSDVNEEKIPGAIE